MRARRCAADAPGTRINWEKGKEPDKQERERSEKIEKSEQAAKRSVEQQVGMLRRQFIDLHGNIKDAAEAFDKLEKFIKEASSKKLVKKVSKLTEEEGGLNILAMLDALSDTAVRPGKDILNKMIKMLDAVRSRSEDEYEAAPSPEVLSKLV